MRKFTDAAGRDWLIEANVDSLRRVKDLVDVDLLTGDGLRRVTSQDDLWQMLELWPNVLWALCLPQCQAREVSQTQWAELLLAESPADQEPIFDAAVTAALEEIGSFFRRVGRKTAATAIEAIVRTKTQRETELAWKAGQRIEEAIGREMTATIDRLERHLQTVGTPSIGSPGPSESTPAG